MKLHYNQFRAVNSIVRSSLLFLLTVHTSFLCSQEKPNQIIDKISVSEPMAWQLASKKGFRVTDLHNPKKNKKCSDAQIMIGARNGELCINEQTTRSDAIEIQALKDDLIYNTTPVGSRVIIKKTDTAWQLIAQQPSVETEERFMVRVLLDEWPAHDAKKSAWHIRTGQGWLIKHRDQVERCEADTTISFAHGRCLINKKPLAGSALELQPIEGNIIYNNHTYHGSLLIVWTATTAYLINKVALEEYVACVLRTESWPGWPLEVNKAFAIACRSYALAMSMRAQTLKLPYHLKNTNAHQTYTGMHTDLLLKQAVEETKHMFLGYQGKPIIAMFDGCCGGVIPAGIKGFNFSQAPYLARSYPCTYCKDCKLYAWQARYPTNALTGLLQKGVPQLKKLRDIKVSKKDRAGLVQEVSIKGARGYAALSGKKVYSLLKEVKSCCFNVKKQGDTITFQGRGHGHHLGLCQWGAREMVRQGHSYQAILKFYYPNTAFMVLT